MLDPLGSRICIMGPSNSGKSTLANALSERLSLDVIHLGRLYHRPDTDWEPREPAVFGALHEAAIRSPGWIIDGNYSRLLPPRLERATGVIILDVSTTVSLYRYLRRCGFESEHAGALDGGRDSVKWRMIRHIAITTRANRRRYRRLFDALALPKTRLGSRRALSEFYRANGLVAR